MSMNSRHKLQKAQVMITSRQHGFSLVELMIAGILGLLLIGGVVQLFLGSKQNFTMQGELAKIQEDGRLALSFLKREIEMAGSTGGSDTGRIVGGVNFPVDYALSTEGGAGSDSIAVIVVDPPDKKDCNGVVVASGKVINTFSVNASNELVCQGNGGGGAQPLISDVASFQVLYGVETEKNCPDGVVGSYLSKSQVEAAGLEGKVHSIKIALLLESDGNVMANDATKAFNVLGTAVSFTSKKVRRLFQQTVFMPNAMLNSMVNGTDAINCIIPAP